MSSNAHEGTAQPAVHHCKAQANEFFCFCYADRPGFDMYMPVPDQGGLKQWASKRGTSKNEAVNVVLIDCMPHGQIKPDTATRE